MAKKVKGFKKKYYIQGMHCSACEMLIKQEVESLKNVDSAKVSLSKSYVEIVCNSKSDIPEHSQLNNLLKDLGYSFHSTKPKNNLTRTDIIKMSLIALVFVLAFYTIESSGLFLKYAVTAQSTLLSYFIFGLAAGISSCAAIVGGLLLALSKQWNELYHGNKKQSVKPFIYFNFSRLLSFALLGGVLGAVGSLLQISITVTSILTVLISLLMLILGMQMIDIKWFKRFSFNFNKGGSKYLNKNTKLQGKYVPIITGALTFIIPCGFTLIAQTNALSSGSFARGFMQLGMFALGTLPVLAAISFGSVNFYSNPKFAKKFSYVSGVIIIFFALYTFNSQLNVLGLPSLSDLKGYISVSSVSDSLKTREKLDYQIMQMEASGLEYFPTKFVIQSGVKTDWEIFDNNSLGCARAVYAHGLYPDVIQLQPGLNKVSFIAPEPGIYKISCSMGMVPPVTVEVY